jgi:hypothetical protein
MKFPITSDDGTLRGTLLEKWTANQVRAFEAIGQPITVADRNAALLRAAGFVNVREVVYKWPVNPWPRAQKEKMLGLWEAQNFLDGLGAFTLATHTRVLGWSAAETEVLMASVRADIKNRKIHAYIPM